MTPLHLALDPARALTLPPPAAGSAETLDVIVGLFVLLLAAKVGEEILRRLGQPGVIGELAGGFVVGPYALGLVVPGETATVLAEIGVVILLFAVGLEIKTDQLLQVGRPALVTAVLGVVFPIAAGVAFAVVAGQPPSTAAFVGLALAATSIGITSRVLTDLGVLDRRFSRIIIGAAVIDDVLALILIGIVSGAAEGDLGLATLGLVVGAIGFVVLGFAVARRARGVRREVFTWPLFADTPIVPVFLVMLALAILAVLIGLAAIIGAFVAGLIVAETEAQDEIEHEIKPLAAVITPFFFAVTGAQLDLGALARSPARPQRGRPRGPGDRHQGPGRTDRRARCRPLERPGRGRRDGAAGRGRDRGRDARPRPGAAHPGPLQRRPGGGRPDDRRGPAHAEPGDPASGRRDRGCRGPVAGTRVGPGARVGLGARRPGSPAGGPIPADSTPAGPSMPAAAPSVPARASGATPSQGSSPVGPASWVPRASPVAASSGLCPLARRKA